MIPHAGDSGSLVSWKAGDVRSSKQPRTVLMKTDSLHGEF